MNRWTIPLDRLAGQSLEVIEANVRKVGFDVFAGVINESPVDKGRFVANWQLSYGTPAVGVIDAVDPDRQQTIAKLAALQRFPMGLWYLTNNLPYGERLEYGWSQKAPQGMVRITAARFRGVFR